MTDHTPTPWSLCGDGNCSCLTLACPDHPIAKVESGEWGDTYPAMRQVGASLENRYEAYMERIGYGKIDQETARANARFILKAVNNHEPMLALLKAYEQWEADIIMENKCWTGQNIRLTDQPYDRMIELQTERNRVLGLVGGAHD